MTSYDCLLSHRVDASGLAEQKGLKVGDQLVEVNGLSFEPISHANAVEYMRSHRQLMVTVRVSALSFCLLDSYHISWPCYLESSPPHSLNFPDDSSTGSDCLRIFLKMHLPLAFQIIWFSVPE